MNKKTILWILILVCLISSVFASVNLTNGLKASFKLDNNGLDSSTNGNDLTSKGTPTYTTGKINFSYTPDGSNNMYLDTPLDTGIAVISFDEMATGFSTSSWIYRTGATSGRGTISGYVSNSPLAAKRRLFYFYTAETTEYLAWQIGDGATNPDIQTSTAIPLNTWTHVGLTYNGSKAMFYINGVNVYNYTYTIGSGYSDTTDGGWGVGVYRQLTTTLRPFPGRVDDQNVWNRAITEEEMHALYNSGNGFTYPFTAPSSNFTISAQDIYNSTSLNIDVEILYNGTTYNFNGTNIDTGLNDDSFLANITISKDNYFDVTYLNYNISSNLTNINLTPYLSINVYDEYNNNTLSNLNIIVNSNTGNETNLFPVDVGLINLSITKSGYDTLTLTNYDTNGFNQSLNLSMNLTYGRLIFDSNIKSYTGNTLSNYSINATSNITGLVYQCSTLTNDTICLVPKSATYEIKVNKELYAFGYANTTIGTDISINVQNITLYTTNSVQIDIFKEADNTRIDNETITILFLDDTGAITYTTDNGSLYVDNLIDGNYTVRFSGDNYSIRNYQIAVADRSYQQLNAYLSDSTNTVIFGAFNVYDNSIEGVTLSMERIINSSWVVIETHNTDITGRTQFGYTPGVEYRFTASKSGYVTKQFNLNPIIFSTYNIVLTATSTSSPTQSYSGISVSYTPKIFYNNETNYFTFIIVSPDGVLTDYTLNLVYPSGSTTRNGTNAYGETFEFNFSTTSVSILDTVNISYNYVTTLGNNDTFSFIYPIYGIIGNNTFMSNKDTTYGMGFFERTLISIVAVILASGLVFMLFGELAGGTIALLIMGSLMYINFLPFWSGIGSILTGITLIIWRSSR